MTKLPVKIFKSRSYLTGVIIDQLRRHLSKMNRILKKQTLLWWFCKTVKIPERKSRTIWWLVTTRFSGGISSLPACGPTFLCQVTQQTIKVYCVPFRKAFISLLYKSWGHCDIFSPCHNSPAVVISVLTRANFLYDLVFKAKNRAFYWKSFAHFSVKHSSIFMSNVSTVWKLLISIPIAVISITRVGSNRTALDILLQSCNSFF